MPKKDPFTYPKMWPRKYATLNEVLHRNLTIGPHLGVTQGGSSRPNPGCKPAATKGVTRATKRNEHG